MNYNDFTDAELLLEAMSMLEEVTPAKFDCGKLCGSRCCKDGENSELGMWLMPGEKEFLKRNTDFRFVKDESGNDCAVCGGECDRELRPFACRIYPYYASLETLPDGHIRIRIKPDPRAMRCCPYVSDCSFVPRRPSAGFVKAFTRAARLLLDREAFRKELFEISGFLDEIGEMREKLLGKA